MRILQNRPMMEVMGRFHCFADTVGVILILPARLKAPGFCGNVPVPGGKAREIHCRTGDRFDGIHSAQGSAFPGRNTGAGRFPEDRRQ